MYCPNCGTNIGNNTETCINCGINVRNFHIYQPENDKSNIWVNLLSLCCVPILGIVMYFVWKEKQPKAAKSALIFGIIGLVIYVIFSIIMIIIGVASETYYNSYYEYEY